MARASTKEWFPQSKWALHVPNTVAGSLAVSAELGLMAVSTRRPGPPDGLLQTEVQMYSLPCPQSPSRLVGSIVLDKVCCVADRGGSLAFTSASGKHLLLMTDAEEHSVHLLDPVQCMVAGSGYAVHPRGAPDAGRITARGVSMACVIMGNWVCRWKYVRHAQWVWLQTVVGSPQTLWTPKGLRFTDKLALHVADSRADEVRTIHFRTVQSAEHQGMGDWPLESRVEEPQDVEEVGGTWVACGSSGISPHVCFRQRQGQVTNPVALASMPGESLIVQECSGGIQFFVPVDMSTIRCAWLGAVALAPVPAPAQDKDSDVMASSGYDNDVGIDMKKKRARLS